MLDSLAEAIILPQPALGHSAGLYIRDNGAQVHKPIAATMGTSEVARFTAEMSSEILKAALSSSWREECRKASEALKLTQSSLESATIEALKAATETFAVKVRESVLAQLAKPEKAEKPAEILPANRALVQRYAPKAAPVAREGK